jgi:hypothetical protein
LPNGKVNLTHASITTGDAVTAASGTMIITQGIPKWDEFIAAIFKGKVIETKDIVPDNLKDGYLTWSQECPATVATALVQTRIDPALKERAAAVLDTQLAAMARRHT